MRFWKASALLLLPLLPAPLAANAAAPLCVSARERADLTDLMIRYISYADAGKGKAFAALFVADGELVFNGQAVQGPARLAAMIDGKADRSLHHPSAPLLVKIASDRVRARSQLIFMRDATAAGEPYPALPQQIGFAAYEDEIVRTREGWKFLRRRAVDMRKIAPEFLTPSANCR